MYEFLNINDEGRKWLKKEYEKMIFSCCPNEIIANLVFQVKSFKYEKPDFYKFLIGLMFIDNYKLLNNDEIMENKDEMLNFYKSLESMDELLDAIEENDEILPNMILSPIMFYDSDFDDKAYMIDELENRVIQEFNPFSFIEKDNLFKNRTMDDVHYVYNFYLVETEYEYDDNDGIDKIIEMLIVLAIGNIDSFKTIILKMLKISYKWHKARYISNEELEPIELKLIQIVENNSIEDIIDMIHNDFGIIELLVDDYFYYFNDTEFIDKDIVDSIYNHHVDEKIKIKLKEV